MQTNKVVIGVFSTGIGGRGRKRRHPRSRPDYRSKPDAQ